jgi:hypothetical protein
LTTKQQKASAFGKRIAHGYLVLSDAAGLFVVAEPGPVLANYGLDTLRFVKPVGLGESIQVRLTCKRKIDRNKKDANGQGAGGGGLGCRSDQPRQRIGSQLRHSHFGCQAALIFRDLQIPYKIWA